MPRVIAVLSAVTIVAGCAGKRVLVPPRVDLAPRVPIGLVTFTAENATGSLPEYTTQRFAQHVLDAQPGIELLELGEISERVDAAQARRLGDEHGIRAVFVGHIVVSDVRPHVSISRGLRASAEATVTITVRMFSSESGGTLWTKSANTREAIAAIRIMDGGVVFSADDPEEAYGDLVNRLVYQLTYDFRSTWQRAE